MLLLCRVESNANFDSSGTVVPTCSLSTYYTSTIVCRCECHATIRTIQNIPKPEQDRTAVKAPIRQVARKKVPTHTAKTKR